MIELSYNVDEYDDRSIVGELVQLRMYLLLEEWREKYPIAFTIYEKPHQYKFCLNFDHEANETIFLLTFEDRTFNVKQL